MPDKVTFVGDTESAFAPYHSARSHIDHPLHIDHVAHAVFVDILGRRASDHPEGRIDFQLYIQRVVRRRRASRHKAKALTQAPSARASNGVASQTCES